MDTPKVADASRPKPAAATGAGSSTHREAPGGDPSPPAIFSQRLRKGRHLQGLLLELARRAIAIFREQDGYCIVRVEDGIVEMRRSERRGDGPATVEAADEHLIAELGATISRQLERLVGAAGFECQAWTHNLPTQPVSLALITPGGRRLEAASRSFSGLRAVRAVVALSGELRAALARRRRPGEEERAGGGSSSP